MSHKPADIARLERYGPETTEYTLAIITDEDHASQVALEDGRAAWKSTLRYDRLSRKLNQDTGQASYRLEEIPEDEGGEHQLMSLIAEGGRGAEFSELVQFGQRLITFDDRTGLVCEIRNDNQLVPRHILMTGNGDEKFKGFKSEWATLKDDNLIVGSHGKKPEEEWIKVLDRTYGLSSADWRHIYSQMREVLGVGDDGYVIHEAADWHPYRREWLFFPRKISVEPYEKHADDRYRGSNRLVVANEDFSDMRVVPIGDQVPERGVSTFKVVPGHPEECIGLKSVEIDDMTETYFFAFDLNGHILQPDTFIGAYKCEGIEIV